MADRIRFRVGREIVDTTVSIAVAGGPESFFAGMLSVRDSQTTIDGKGGVDCLQGRRWLHSSAQS